MKRIIVGAVPGESKPAPVTDPQKKEREKQIGKKPSLNTSVSKGIFKRIADIVVDDIKRVVGKDKKSRRNRSLYNDFMENYFPELVKK